MKKILFCLLLLPCLIQAQRLTVDSVLLKKQGVIPAKWVSVKTFSAIDTINEIQTLYNHNLYDLKSIDTTTRTKVLTRKATDSLINYALTGTVDTKGNWDASGNTLPSTSVKTGDKWTISVKGFVSPDSFYVGDVIIAKIDDPGQTVTNWNHIYASQPKSINLVLSGSSQVGALKYNGRVAKGGAFHGGNVALVSDTSYLNFSGTFRANSVYTVSGLYVPANSGLYYNASNYITIASNNVRFVSNSIQAQLVNGNFGVNVTNNSPAARFHGHTTGTGETAMLLTNTTTGLGISDGVSLNLVNGKDATLRLSEYNSSFNVEYRSVKKMSIDSVGYLYNLRPTFSSVFFDSTRVIELDLNTPKIISNTWGNLWPNSVLVGFTENKDTAIVGYTGNYNIDLDLNAYVEASVNFRYYVKKRPANTTSVTTIYRKEVSNSGTIVNRNIPLNTNLNVGDRIWFEIENITNGNDVTVYGGTIRIVANYLNP